MKLEFPTISKFFYPTRNGLGRKMLIKRLKSSCPPNVIISNIKINLSAYAPPIFSPFFHIHMYCASVQFLQVTVTITLPICPHVSEGHFWSSKAYSLVNFFPKWEHYSSKCYMLIIAFYTLSSVSLDIKTWVPIFLTTCLHLFSGVNLCVGRSSVLYLKVPFSFFWCSNNV